MLNPKVPAGSMAELVQLARAKPGSLSYASYGNGSSAHLAGEMLRTRAGIDVLHVPYKGSAPAKTATIAGEVSMTFEPAFTGAPLIRSGQLKAVAVMGGKRSDALPDVPTTAEVGIGDAVVSNWWGLAAPKGTPADIVNTLNAAIEKALRKPDVQKRFADLGAVAVQTTPAEFGEFIKSEVATWAKVVKASGATVD